MQKSDYLKNTSERDKVITYIAGDDEGGYLVSADMTNDCIAQSWFRFLHIIQNPVDLAKPEMISQTPMFLQLALESEIVVDPRQHECLHKLPQIFYKAMRGLSIMVNAFLGKLNCYSCINGSHARKLDFVVCAQQRCRPACALVQSDQHLCYSFS